MPKTGRPPRYNNQFSPKLAELLARLGYTDKEAAAYMGIAECTYTRWKQKHSELRTSIKKGKAHTQNQIEHALYKNAIGYNYIETKIEYEMEKDKNGKEKKVKKKIIEHHKHQPGIVLAEIFSLKNIDPEKWRDRKDINVKGSMNVRNFDIKLSPEDEKAYKDRIADFLEISVEDIDE